MRRTESLKIRLSTDERATIGAQAEAAGLTISTYIRESALAGQTVGTKNLRAEAPPEQTVITSESAPQANRGSEKRDKDGFTEAEAREVYQLTNRGNTTMMARQMVRERRA